MGTKIKQYLRKKCGSVLVLIVVSLVTLAALGLGMLTVAYGVRHQATVLKNEAMAMLAAEAGYEKAVFWMSRQMDMLSALQSGTPGTSGTMSFPNSDCDYRIEFYTFIGSRPIYRIISNGRSGAFNRTVDVRVVQAISGWDMGMCRVPSGSSSTYPVHYANGEIIDIPIHINNLNDNPDDRDIYISGSPQFLQTVAMGESRHTAGGSDKYASAMSFFDGGIYFDQPDSRITDEASVQTKVGRFEASTKAQFNFTPAPVTGVPNPQRAVHLEFFVDGGVGKLRITNNCMVRGFKQSSDSRTWDFKITPGSDANQYERYHIYAYHLMPEDADSTGERFIRPIDQTYVTQSFGGVESEPGGQIFVDGNVIIGSGDPTLPGIQDTVKGEITVVATGNIWVTDSTVVDGAHDADGRPSSNNPNVLGLIAQGVIRVVDPGMSEIDGPHDDDKFDDFEYIPIGRPDYPSAEDDDEEYNERHLPDPTVIEAAVTAGGGGWGAENVRRGSYGGRKEASGNQDDLVVRGTITEACRGVVGLVGGDGYLKHYYLDARFLEGILPGDLWLRGKFVSAPAGWHDYRSVSRTP